MQAEIHGQVRIENRPAPQGVLVLLDVAPSFRAGAVGNGQLGRTMTDSGGKFVFDGLTIARGGDAQFLVTVHCSGYKDASQVADLRGSPRGFVSLDLQRDTSADVPNVPSGGPGETISAKQPSSPEARAALAKAQELLIEKHDAKGSIEGFKKTLKLDPQYGPGYVLLGTAYMQTQEWEDAKSAFEKASKLEPGNSVAFLGIGAAMNQQGDFTGALKPLQHSLDMKADSAEAHYEMGRSLWGLQKWQDAEPHARKSIEVNREFAPSHVLMGNIYLRRRDANSALTEFNEYLRLDPQGQHAAAVKEMVEKIQKALGQR